jgi:C_GCAxxG_C_C family probable redox protein
MRLSFLQGDCMHTKSDTAVAKLLEGYNCAQAVLYSFCEHLSFEKTTACKIACGFGAGMGRKEEACGAVSGGIMALGLRHGRGEEEDIAATELTYKKTTCCTRHVQDASGARLRSWKLL